MPTEKILKYKLCRVANPSKRVSDLNCEVQDLLLQVVDLRYEVPDLRSRGIRPSLTRVTDWRVVWCWWRRGARVAAAAVQSGRRPRTPPWRCTPTSSASHPVDSTPRCCANTTEVRPPACLPSTVDLFVYFIYLVVVILHGRYAADIYTHYY